jgi:DnaJ-class molecular chaperone
MSKAVDWLARLLKRIGPDRPCLRCRGTGAWRGLDCPDCEGGGRMPVKNTDEHRLSRTIKDG